MAHEINIRANGFAEMAFVGETPWHGLGQRVTEGATVETWQREAGMDWEAIQRPLTYVDLQGNNRTFDGKLAIFRSDTGAPLSVMSDSYKVVQPREVLEFFRDATESGGWHIHTAGVLHGGRRMWAMARMGDACAQVAKGDRVKPNLLLYTALDGTSQTIAKPIVTRVVCANTVAAALGEFGQVAKVSHRSVFDPETIYSAMRRAGSEFDAFLTAAQRMAETHVTMDEARKLLKSIFEKPVKETPAPVAGDPAFAAFMAGLKDDAKAPKDHRNVTRILELFAGEGRGATHAGSMGTRWGLLNAVTEFVDHEAARNGDNRLSSAWFGKGDEIKTQVAELLTA